MAQRVSVEDWPRLTRFYGISPSELARMPHALLRLYAEELFVLSAEEAILGFITADMPHATKDARARTFRNFEAWLPAPEPEKADPHTRSGQAVIAGMGIGIVGVPITEVESPVETTDA